eukprot:1016313-Pelagomonas_calceolata.AAC.7
MFRIKNSSVAAPSSIIFTMSAGSVLVDLMRLKYGLELSRTTSAHLFNFLQELFCCVLPL